jgi:hypothetical protein
MNVVSSTYPKTLLCTTRVSESTGRGWKKRISVLFALPLVLFCAGCVHRPLQIKKNYSLEEVSELPLLVPSIPPKTVDGDFQTSLVTLSGKRMTNLATVQQCSIKGSVFSLEPDGPRTSNRWFVKSPSIQGWAKHGGEINLGAEWSSFTRDLLSLQGRGCFPLRESLSAVTRAVAEAMPLPASESLLFFYSFGGGGFADLAPGMQIKVERPLPDSLGRGNTASGYRGSLDAQYEVITSSESGVALHLSKTENRRSEKSQGPEGALIFRLSTRFATKPMLRLFLQSLKSNNTLRSPVLIGTTNAADLESATKQIEESSSGGCPSVSSAAIECVSFGKGTAVSVLSSVWINDRLRYLPLGTTVGYVVEVHSKDGHEQAPALQTISLKRPLATGGYAEVTFPRALASARQVILLNGDRLSWQP